MPSVVCQVTLIEGGYLEFEGECLTSEAVFVRRHYSGFVCSSAGVRRVPFIWSRDMWLPLKGLIEFTQRHIGAETLMEALILDEKVVGWATNDISIHANAIECISGTSLDPPKEIPCPSVLERVLENTDF